MRRSSFGRRLRIGQTWRHKRGSLTVMILRIRGGKLVRDEVVAPEVVIRQLHDMDEVAEVWVGAEDERRAYQVPYAQLRARYRLVEADDA